MRIDVFSLFPGLFEPVFAASILGRAQGRNLVSISSHDIRDFASDRHRTVDDTPYGGGAGMVMKAPPVVHAVESVLDDEMGAGSADTAADRPGPSILVMSASGRPFDQAMAKSLASVPHLVVVCGHYEGIDQRAIDILGAEEVSIGDFVLTGGELAAMVVVDAVVRLVPGVIDVGSIEEESFEDDLLEYPHYTRPATFRGHGIPPVLLSGHHAQIAAWRRERSRERTAERRPDLIRRRADRD
ncbi:MAG: tRNA (guanosine(37)-N1)-methyltransferase TrmD [Thermomicrobiales bacterium]